MVYLRIMFHNMIKGKAYRTIFICKATALGLANGSTMWENSASLPLRRHSSSDSQIGVQMKICVIHAISKQISPIFLSFWFLYLA